MSDLIEEAAKAICCQGGQCMNANSTKFECNSQFFVEEARAVLTRLREPTPWMVAAGGRAFMETDIELFSVEDAARIIFIEMIDAAKEGPK